MTTLVIGFFVGVGTFIAFLGRMDRANGSGCFYALMLGLVILMAGIVMLAIAGV